MKTYILDTVNRLKRYSKSLDIKTEFCNKSWWAFNDTGEKTLYILQEDGCLYVTINGRGIKGLWDYISANKTIIFNYDNIVLMFHPEFMDENLLCLNLDGTNEHAFLIEEQNRDNFAPKTLSQLAYYFEHKESMILAEERRKLRIAEEQRRREVREEQERLRRQAIEDEERRKKELEQQRINEPFLREENLKYRAAAARKAVLLGADAYGTVIFKAGLISIANFLISFIVFQNFMWGIYGSPIIFIIILIICFINIKIKNVKRLKEYKATHSHVPFIKYV